MKKVYIIIGIFLIVACSKSEIDTWNAKPRVWFMNANDTTYCSFYTQPEGSTEFTIERPLSMAGMIAATDREVTLKDLGGSKYNLGSKYELLSAVIFADTTQGVVRIKIYKTANLDVADDTISFEICSSDEFETGLSDNLRTTLILSNRLSKPGWWDWYAECNLGYYSDLKLSIIYDVFGSDEIFNGKYGWFSDDMTIAIYTLNQHCKKNNICYPGSEEIVWFGYFSN